MKIVNHIKSTEWKNFLKNCPEARLVHTPEWKDFLEKSFDFHSKHLFALNDNDEVKGILPLFKCGRLPRGSRLCSSPFSGECKYVGDQEFFGQVLEKAIESIDGSKYLEMRSYILNSGFEVKNFFSTYVLDLTPNIAHIWGKLNRGSVRWAIKKSTEKGVRVVETNNVEDLKSFYELNCLTKKDKGVPCHPWEFFNNMFELMGEYSKLYMSIYENEAIAGGIMNYFKDYASYGYGASNSNYLSLYPNNALVWKSIEDACSAGFKYYDFGRVSYDNVGLIDFKKRWGTVERKLYYSYYPNRGKSLTDNRSDLKFKIATSVIRRTPKIIYEHFSNKFFGYFG